ncbi:hypothetical protein YC2023_020463 [Brassica napus]
MLGPHLKAEGTVTVYVFPYLSGVWCFSSSPEKDSHLSLVLPCLLHLFQLMLGTTSPWLGQSLVVFDVVFLVVGLPSIISARLAFIASLVALPFTMFATRGLDNVSIRVCYVGLEGYFWCAELVSWSFDPFYPELSGHISSYFLVVLAFRLLFSLWLAFLVIALVL